MLLGSAKAGRPAKGGGGGAAIGPTARPHIYKRASIGAVEIGGTRRRSRIQAVGTVESANPQGRFARGLRLEWWWDRTDDAGIALRALVIHGVREGYPRFAQAT